MHGFSEKPEESCVPSERPTGKGDTRDEALANIREAIELCLENQAVEGSAATPT